MALAVAACWWAWMDAWLLVSAPSSNGYVLLVPAVVALLYWVRRHRLPQVRVTGSAFGPLIMGLGWVFFTVGPAYAVSSFYHFGALLIAVGAAVCVFGKGIILRFLPAATALLFLVPLPGRVRHWLSVPLDHLTEWLAVGVFRLFGGTVEIDGVNLIVGHVSGALRLLPRSSTADGVPVLLSLLLLAYTVAFALPLRDRYRWVLLLLALPAAVVFSVLRSVWLLLAATRLGENGLAGATVASNYTAWIALPFTLGLLLLALRVMKGLGLRVERYRLANGRPGSMGDLPQHGRFRAP